MLLSAISNNEFDTNKASWIIALGDSRWKKKRSKGLVGVGFG